MPVKRRHKQFSEPTPMTAIVVSRPSELAPRRPEMEAKLKAKLHQYVVDSVPENTRKGYASDVKQFAKWCADMGYRSMPADPGTVALYITAMATGDIDDRLPETERSGPRKIATIERAMSGIAMKHREAGLLSPVNDDVKAAYKGLRRSLTSKQDQKKPLLDDDVEKIVASLPSDPLAIRDAALILIGQHAALRRDELERMDWSWLTFGDKGLLIEIPYSKASQAKSESVIVPRASAEPCPVAALERWRDAASGVTPHVFCQFTRTRKQLSSVRISGFGIARTVKRLVKAYDIGDPAIYSGHSLRRGFVTQQDRNGVPIATIMETTRHKSYDTVRRYIEKQEALSRIGKVK